MNGDIEAAKIIISAGGNLEHKDKVNTRVLRTGKNSLGDVIQRQITGCAGDA